MLRKKCHIDQIDNDWYQLHSFKCQYLGAPLLWCCHIYLSLDLVRWLIQRRILLLLFECGGLYTKIKPLRSNTQRGQTKSKNCLSVFDHFVGLAFKGLIITDSKKLKCNNKSNYISFPELDGHKRHLRYHWLLRIFLNFNRLKCGISCEFLFRRSGSIRTQFRERRNFFHIENINKPQTPFGRKDLEK